MTQFVKKKILYDETFVSLHDARFNHVYYHEGSVFFEFSDGFSVIEKGVLSKVTYGRVEFAGVNFEDLFCHIFKRKKSKKGSRLIGNPITPEELDKYLSKNGWKVELVLELYDSNHIHWRGIIVPSKMSRKHLSTLVTIDLMDCCPIIYSWEK